MHYRGVDFNRIWYHSRLCCAIWYFSLY